MANAADTTVKLHPELAAELDEYAVATGRSRAELVATAVATFLAEERLALKRIERGFHAVIALGEVASAEELDRIFAVYPREGS